MEREMITILMERRCNEDGDNAILMEWEMIYIPNGMKIELIK